VGEPGNEVTEKKAVSNILIDVDNSSMFQEEVQPLELRSRKSSVAKVQPLSVQSQQMPNFPSSFMIKHF